MDSSGSTLGRLFRGLGRTRESLAQKLRDIVSGAARIDEDLLERVEAALLLSDVGPALTSEVIRHLRQSAAGRSIQGWPDLVDLVRAQMKKILEAGPGGPPLSPVRGPEVVLLVGVNGGGKTTTAGKLAARWTREGKRGLLCAADTFRAAAVEQIEIWAQRAGVGLIRHQDGADPSAVVFDAADAALARGCDFLIIDTAGRLHTREPLMKELEKVVRVIRKRIPDGPHQVLLVLDATTGQNGVAQARKFLESTGVTGLVLTKLDGTAKGGVALGIARELGIPLRWVGVGEEVEDLVEFDPDAYVDGVFEERSPL
ncbi:MAG TPA: signal recognition particle-docking protein FtsY [Candidatus Polarisedimenticolia bacterium]|jgi:fused signal recognition particle receptor|nr:signal recognition particle-docking protein FtsY [Candidatus Polarisedimenticolia bacterium]